MGRPLLRKALDLVLGPPLYLVRKRALHTEQWRARGIEIRIAFVRGDHAPYAQRAANALGAIARNDPNRMARIKRDVSAILIWPYVMPGAVAQFHRRDSVCAIDSAQVLDAHSALIALWIVHEATHARLSRFHGNEDTWPRIERICKEQELAFATRLPDGAELVAALREELEWYVQQDHTRIGQVERGAAALAAEGAPRWAIWAMRAVMRFVNGPGAG